MQLDWNTKMAPPLTWDLEYEEFYVKPLLSTIPELFHLLDAILYFVGMSGSYTRLKTPWHSPPSPV